MKPLGLIERYCSKIGLHQQNDGLGDLSAKVGTVPVKLVAALDYIDRDCHPSCRSSTGFSVYGKLSSSKTHIEVAESIVAWIERSQPSRPAIKIRCFAEEEAGKSEVRLQCNQLIKRTSEYLSLNSDYPALEFETH